MQLQAFAPFEYTGTGIATVLLALSVSWLINAICEVFDGSRSIRLFVAANLDDALVLLFQEAINTESPLLVTLATRKVYVGYISEALYRKSKDPFFSLALLLSGYRDEGTLEFRESINYIEHGDLGDFEITIPMSQVVSAHLFNIDRYNAVFGRKLVLPSSN
ncbi:MAG TPA: hypothetical protein VE621_13245 [Bryobacteraceae bacterium]|nr:hypothetical protein [Bryobacteraceae bacterium]